MALDLPIAQPDTATERADAARNRERILAAASGLVARRGIDAVSMDDVAQAAGVGTGTVYRRFGDRSGLAVALLDEQARALQDRLLSGPPPLGPGAPAGERLLAFGEHYVALLEEHAPLMCAAGSGAGPHAAWILHLSILLRQAVPALDAHWTAEALMATLGANHHRRLRGELGWDSDRIVAGWRTLVRALLATA